jgi:hypothetical protein
MKKFNMFFASALMGLSLVLGGCSKDDDPAGSGDCPSGSNFCMQYAGVQKSGTASFRVISASRYRISWEKNAGNTYEQVELDIYGNAAGTFAIDTTYAAGTAGFEYFSTNPNALEQGVSGSVQVSSFDPNGGVSGTFSVTTANGIKITKGTFTNVQP